MTKRNETARPSPTFRIRPPKNAGDVHVDHGSDGLMAPALLNDSSCWRVHFGQYLAIIATHLSSPIATTAMDAFCEKGKIRVMSLTLEAWREQVREQLVRNKRTGAQPDSQAKLARTVGLTDPTILNKMLQGKRDITATEIGAISRALGRKDLSVVDGYEKSTGNLTNVKDYNVPSTVNEVLQPQNSTGYPMKALDRMGLRDLLTRYSFEQLCGESLAILAEERAKLP